MYYVYISKIILYNEKLTNIKIDINLGMGNSVTELDSYRNVV